MNSCYLSIFLGDMINNKDIIYFVFINNDCVIIHLTFAAVMNFKR